MTSKFIFFLSFAVAACAFPALAQKVVVTGRKQVYMRPKPSSDYKKSFTIRRPSVKAATPALSRRITAAVDPIKVLEIDIAEEVGEIQWLSEADYKVEFNDKGILAVTVWMEGSGAYPDGVSKYVVVDTATGRRVTPGEVFSDLAGLARAVKLKQDAAVAEAIKVMKADPDFAEEDPKQLFAETNLQAKDLEGFSVDAAGVTFVYDYGFPHVIRALEPDSEFKLSWEEMKPFIRKGGLLARFVP